MKRWLLLTLSLCVLWSLPAVAGQTVLRDAETEAFIHTLAKPLFEAAGIPPTSVQIVLVQDRDVNAFVAGGMNLFIYTGLLQTARSPDALLGVLAHEIGHIAGGHLLRSDEAVKNASYTAILTTLAGVAAAVASRDGGAGMAAASLGAQVAERNLLSYSRTQEATADQAALRYLDRAGFSAAGLEGFLQQLANEEMLPQDQQSAFMRTHPLTQQRVQAVAAHVATAGQKKPVPPALEAQFWRVMAKLNGYLDPRGTLARVKGSDFNSRYAQAVAWHQVGDTIAALKAVAWLHTQEPKNPYIYELEGQILYETGQPLQAVTAYEKALALAGGNVPLIKIALAQALIAANTSDGLPKAVATLETVLQSERQSPSLWQALATAYGKQGQVGMATYALAEEAAVRGDTALAQRQAKRAQQLLPAHSAGWLRAGDLLAQLP